MDEICLICNEPRSAHVETERGPLTHPREARGEGEYIEIGGGVYYAGLRCQTCPGGVCEGHPYSGRWEFEPNEIGILRDMADAQVKK